MSLNDNQIQLLQKIYNDESLGLTTGQKLYNYLKSNGETGYTLSKVNEFLKSLEVNQVLTKRRGDISFVAEGPLEQFQIDLIYMPKSWFNNGFKYIFACVDVFSKKADMIPLKDREQTTTTKAFEKILNNIGIPKTIYSDQGSEFKNNTFQKLLDKHNIQIIFALGHAPFVESFNKTMKNRMMKYMKLKNTDNWSKIMTPVLDAYNNSPHSTTKIAPNKVNKDNEMQVKMNIHKRAKKKSNYPKLEIGDNVRVPVIHKQHKGYKDSFSMETHKVEDINRGLYTVDGSLHPRKDLQLVKGNVIKAPTKTKAQQKQRDIQNKVGKSLNNPEVKDLVGTRTKKETKEILESDRKTRSQTTSSTINLRSRTK
jgi:transposase InsO family protein